MYLHLEYTQIMHIIKKLNIFQYINYLVSLLERPTNFQPTPNVAINTLQGRRNMLDPFTDNHHTKDWLSHLGLSPAQPSSCVTAPLQK